MKKYIAALMMVLSFSVFAEALTTVPMVLPIRVIVDGDTIGTTIKELPYPLGLYKIRIYGIDTPEKGSTAKCEKEKVLGKKATEVLQALAKDKREMTVYNCKHDKYGGRFVCMVSIGGRDVAKELMASGLAYEYYGGAKRSWCN